MKPSTVLLAATLALTGAASALALAGSQGTPALAGSSPGDEPHHAGPDSTRIEAFLGALHAADPMICEMVADQLGNFWSSDGEYGIGALAETSRNWEPARDSLASPVTDPAALRRLVRGLDDPNACARRAVAKMLGRSHERAAGQLRESLRNASARVREAAALALGHADSPVFLGDLDRATHDETPAVVAMATWALGEIERHEAIGRLSELTRSRDIKVRRAAAWGLGAIEDPRGVPPLLPLLRDADPGTRAVTAAALGDIESPAALEALIAVVVDQ
jgi:HEAT repeat protein